jgi:putative membrane protein
MPSHAGSRPRGHWSEETGEFETVGLIRRGGGRGRGLVRFWPVMALLTISVGSAWLVTDNKADGSQGINFANNNRPATAAPPANGNRGGTGTSGGAPTGKPANGKPSNTKPRGGAKPPAQVPLPSAPDAGGTQTEFGPLSDADKNILTSAHLAALWQRPTALDAAKRATNPKLRDAAARVAAEHKSLDAKAVATAAALNVTLPDRPNAEQAAWMKELAGKRGTEFDQLLVSRLRTAQGKMLPLVGEVRSTTQNTMVRAFTQVASTSVLRAMTFIDNTGLVTGTGSAPNPPGDAGGAQQAPNPPAAQPDPPASNGGTNGGTAGPNGNDLLPGDALPGETAPVPAQPANPGGNGNGNTNGNANGNQSQAPSGDVPSLPSAPQAQPAQPSSPELATKSNWLGGGDKNMYLILGMIAIAVMISLIALRGFARRG